MIIFLERQVISIKQTYEEIQAQLRPVIEQNQPIQQYMKSIGKEATLENVMSEYKTNKNFRNILESELDKAGLLAQWQQFVTEFERRQAFGVAKDVGEAQQAGRTASSAVLKNQEGGLHAEKLARDLLKKVHPSKLQPPPGMG